MGGYFSAMIYQWVIFQGRIQDFKLGEGGAHLKKIARVFRVLTILYLYPLILFSELSIVCIYK
jgi:hypothetical protein